MQSAPAEVREEKWTVRFPYNEFVLTRVFENVVEVWKIYSKLHPLCKFDTPSDWLHKSIAHDLFALGFESCGERCIQ